MIAELEGNVCIIKLPQYFSAGAVKEMVQLAREALGNKRSGIVVDFTSTEMIDSAGIGTLVSLAKDTKASGTSLTLRSLNEELYQLFLDTDLDKIFTIETATGTHAASINLFEQSAEIRLDIRHESRGAAHILHLGGIMNHPQGSRYFKQEFLLALADSKRIVLDLEELTFFDSLSVSDILTMNKLLKETGGNLRICGANYIVNDLFSTLNIDQVVPFYDKLSEALADWVTS
jgi:anti-sigma B factor antagonist